MIVKGGIDMLNKMERMMMEQMLADLEALRERFYSDYPNRGLKMDTEIRNEASGAGSVNGRIHLLKKLLQVLK